MMLLLPEGDRLCEECQGKGIVPEEYDNGYECYDIEVPCEHCENGRVTERQNMKRFDMDHWNRMALEFIRNARFRAAIKRRSCEGRGVKFDRFILRFHPDRGEPVCLESGPVIELGYHPPQTFTCAMCGEVFDSDRSDEDAIAELHRDFGDVPMEECDVVCDDCYQRVSP